VKGEEEKEITGLLRIISKSGIDNFYSAFLFK